MHIIPDLSVGNTTARPSCTMLRTSFMPLSSWEVRLLGGSPLWLQNSFSYSTAALIMLSICHCSEASCLTLPGGGRMRCWTVLILVARIFPKLMLPFCRSRVSVLSLSSLSSSSDFIKLYRALVFPTSMASLTLVRNIAVGSFKTFIQNTA